MFQPFANVDHRPDCPAQTQQIAPQPIQAIELARDTRFLQHFLFERVHFGLNALDDGAVIVDDEIQDGIENVVLALRKRGGARFAASPHGLVRCRRAVPDRYDVAFPDENMCLAERNLIVDNLRRARHHEQRVAILFDLRLLMCFRSVFDRQGVQVELGGNTLEQRLVRLVQSDPDDMMRLLRPSTRVLDRNVRDTQAIGIHARGDHAWIIRGSAFRR